MGFIIGILTVVLVLTCLLLILLVLIQLPKKEAGAALAFGGGATDALFGAGSGNALTKITKYATIVFFALTLIVGYLQVRQHRSLTGDVQNLITAPANQPTTTTPPASTPGAGATALPPVTNGLPTPSTNNLATPPAPPAAKQ